MEQSSPSTKRAVIELINATIVSRRMPDVVSVEAVNWTVREGDFWIIGGLQGSGKSDLLAAAAALSKPTAGVYRLFGQEIAPTYADECLAERLRVALVFGDGGRLFSHLTVAENVALPLQYHQHAPASETKARVLELLEATEITEWKDALPSGLNRSRRQRAALARALALRPEVLLLDNPLAGLDPRQVRWWMDFLGRLSAGHSLPNGRPMTIVVAADDLRPWQTPQYRFALLQDTRLKLLDEGTSFETDRTPMLRELLSAEPDLT